MNYEAKHPRPKIILGQVTSKENDASKRHRTHLCDEAVTIVLGIGSQSHQLCRCKII
jgi:hypothetical protein